MIKQTLLGPGDDEDVEEGTEETVAGTEETGGIEDAALEND